MRYLLDSGILLRLVNRSDAIHQHVRSAVRELRRQQHTFVTASQNVAEFWNVCTRPATARGGLGLTVEETAHRLRILERGVQVLPELSGTYAQWRSLVTTHSVAGVQVHDARLAALVLSHGITHLLTLNKSDFARYPGLTALGPDDVIPAPPTAPAPPQSP